MYFDVNDLRLAQLHYELAAEVDPSFPNVYFNLALVQAINNEIADAVTALTKYQELAPEAERRNADELMENLKKSLAATKSSRARGTSGKA
jgi:Flp pilus assembly protein TadD